MVELVKDKSFYITNERIYLLHFCLLFVKVKIIIKSEHYYYEV